MNFFKLFQFPLLLLQKAIARLKVFQHIVLIILVMAVFLVVQGLVAMNTFNQMQDNTQKVFKESVANFITIGTLKEEFYRLQYQYLANITGSEQNVLNFDKILGQDLGCISQGKEKFLKAVAELRKLGSIPYTREKYQLFCQKVLLVRIYLEQAENDLTNRAIDSREIGRDLFNRSYVINIVLLIFSLLVTLSLGVQMAATISTPLKEMAGVADFMARGDFTKLVKVKGNREVNQLVNGLNHAITSLRNLVTHISEQAQALAQSGKELSEASNESGKSASEVARAMDSMSQSAIEQTGEINAMANNVTKLGQLVTQVANDAQTIAKSSGQVAQSAQVGQKISYEVAAGIDGLYTTIKEVSTVINEMNRSSQKINDFSEFIGRIAEQTALLALNASIEAARAGEHGRGFSVVAVETGKLAEQSKQAAEIISSLIGEIMTRNYQAVASMQKGVGEVETNKYLTAKAAATFENIFGELEQNLSQIHIVAKSARKMEGHNGEVTHAVNSVALISEQAMATMEEVSAAAEEQSAGAEQVAALAGNLLNIAETMKKAVATFKV